MKLFVPTNGENISNRLFIRYLSFYLCATVIGCMIAARGVTLFVHGTVALLTFLPIPAALLASLLSVSNTYLMLLTALKGLYDAQLLWRITLLVRSANIGILKWNACFFLIAFSLVLFLLAATDAARFAFENEKRDLSLIFSSPFAKFLLEAVFLIVFSILVYLLWPRLLLEMPTL